MTLQATCVKFIATHAELLDSLEGFPEEIGKRLWDALVALPDKLNGHQGATILANFTHAYPALVLHSCQLSNIVVLDKHDLQFFALFQFVRQLDLAGCKMGSNHDLLPQIHSFQSLVQLSLSENALDDSGIANLINPYLYRGGFPRLKELDLSFNSLTSKSVARCLKVPNLQRLVLSIDVESEFCKVLRRKNRVDWNKIETKGWALHLLNSWLKETKMQIVPQHTSPNFYGRPRPAFSAPRSQNAPSKLPIFMYERRKISLKRKLESINPTTSCEADSVSDRQLDYDILNKYYKR
ncbi:hypothetical protein TCAL_09531 [Tigriopus californicus]|uniref:Uncharacterized protein n=1 Tax=Tigriopus californicus TaxID=6832 RepID=A0A553N9W4_TIGCA|nr:hypothetical protein TCAL_09531 [Tigriopus californicus]|eukprot:TCALIF_09531-PA protein Name:"Similar to lrrc42 Leucine-rich repeat-containing protein 42 (Danio rerio)" AED:0.36 eAED:0.39 QI:0/-1/0/1/-1/1/1/0/294